MDEIFKNMIEEHFYKDIFTSLQSEITDNFNQYDLTLRAALVKKVMGASLDTVEVLKTYNVQQEDEEVSFMVLTNCCIEIEDYAYGETLPETIRQWFELSCSAILKNAEFIDFSVDEIKAYNK